MIPKTNITVSDLEPNEVQRRPRILVVDDEPVIAETLAIILRQSGFDTATANDGEQALVRAGEWKPDLLLTDVVMPKMNGIEAAIQIRSELPACKILLFSGQAVTRSMLEDERIAEMKFDILEKPIHPADLLERIRNV